MAAAIDRLGRRVKRLARMAADLQALAIDLSTELGIIRQVLAEDASGRLDVAAELALHRAGEVRRRAEKRAAAIGASKLEMRFTRGGAAFVRIDGSEWFRLTRADARLLRMLAGGSPDRDDFPAWQTYDQLRDGIAEKTGTRPTPRAVIESVYRIRKALRSADVNEYLLQGDRNSRRLRLLVRSPARGEGISRHHG